MASSGERIADTLQAVDPDGVAREQVFVLVDLPGKMFRKVLNLLVEDRAAAPGEAADAEVAGHHALAGDGLEDAENLFALAEAVEEDGERADVHGVRAEPDQVRLDAGELVEQDAEILGAFGNFEAEQLLHREAVGEVVGHRAEIVDAVGEGNDLLVELGLAGLLDAGVQIADVGSEARRRFRRRSRAQGGARHGSKGAADPC